MRKTRSFFVMPIYNITMLIVINETKESTIKRTKPCGIKLIIRHGITNDKIVTNSTLKTTSFKNMRIGNPIILCNITRRAIRQETEIKIDI